MKHTYLIIDFLLRKIPNAMTRAVAIVELDMHTENIRFFSYIRFFLFGLLLPLGFAPFHIPGLTFIGVALLYNGLMKPHPVAPFLSGYLFGLGFFGFGISWIYISIHDFGHLPGIVAAGITLIFLSYLSLFPALLAWIFSRFAHTKQLLYSGSLFSLLWLMSEGARAYFLTGFPWLLLGFGQIDTPLKYFLPIVGTYGTGLIACFAATLLSNGFRAQGKKRTTFLLAFVSLVILPFALKPIQWVEVNEKPISVGIIQANLSMRDKWDEQLFWDLLTLYDKKIHEILGTAVIVLPESAIPVPSSYVSDYLNALQEDAQQAGSSVLLGIPSTSTTNESYYFNTIMGIGHAKGSYLKQHLVPFGEYVPHFLQSISTYFGMPEANIMAGKPHQAQIQVGNYSIASLICYEIAYAELLRTQLPAADWIVSLNDDGWFGHSLALYQQLQMAQILALEAGRYHVFSNNDGLSSIINQKGEITGSLPAYSSGVLQTTLRTATGATPWVIWGDKPIFIAGFWGVLGLLAYKRAKFRQK